MLDVTKNLISECNFGGMWRNAVDHHNKKNENHKVWFGVTPDKKFQCMEYRAIFKRKPGIYKHIKSHCEREKQSVQTHKCDIC